MNNGLDFKQLFDIAPGRFLVLSPDAPRFTILAATDEYLSATKTKREEIVGKGIFEVFPDNPAAPAVKAVGNARTSFLRVIGLRTPDTMGITQQDIPRPDGRFETRFWDVTNFPIFGTEGEVTAIMHRVEDVTRYVQQRKKEAELESATVALKDARRAALNLMEDAMDAKREAEQVSEKLRQEFEEHQRADKEIASLSRFPLENPNPVMRVDAEATLLFANPASAPILDCWHLAIGGRLSAEVEALVTKALKSGRSKQIEIDCDGRIFDFVFAPVPEEGYVNLYARDITERKLTDAALHQSELKYRVLFENMAEGFALYELLYDQHSKPTDWRVLEINEAYTHQTGVSPEQIVGKRVSEVFPAVVPEYLPYFSMVVEKQTSLVRETFAKAVGRYQHVTTFPAGGNRFANVIMDITERKKAEDALRITQKSVDTAAEMIAWFTPDGNIHYANDAACRMLGYPREELLKMPALDITPGFTQEQYADLWREVRERKTLTVEVVYRRKNGSEYPAEVLINYVEFSGQEYLFAYGKDITERKKAEEALKASKFKAQAEKRQLEAILKALPVGVVVTDAKGGIVLTNEMDERIWGPRPVTISTDDYVHYIAWWADSGKEVEPHEWASAQAVLKGKPVLGQVLKIQRFDGRQAYIHNSAFPIRDDTGTIIGSAVAIQDITEVRTADQVLRESEKKYRELFTSMVEGFALHEIILDEAGRPADYRFIEINPAFEAMTGLKADNIVGRTVREVIPGIESSWIETYGKVALGGNPVNFENYAAPLGKWYQVQVYSPAPHRFATIFSDITDRKKADKLKDEFIGMISHELKTPITVVMGALSTAAMPGLPEKTRAGLFQDAVNHADMLASIIDNLLELSRQQSNRLELRKKAGDIGGIACDIAEQLRKKSAIHEIICDFPEGLPKVPADLLRIERIIYNLVENAIKYSPAGGEVRVFGKVTDGFLCVGVSDQGIGIAPENQAKLFQQFERLGVEVKGAIQGTGMGLRVCRILAEAHGGKIWVESVLGKGSTFYFSLPLTNGEK